MNGKSYFVIINLLCNHKHIWPSFMLNNVLGCHVIQMSGHEIRTVTAPTVYWWLQFAFHDLSDTGISLCFTWVLLNIHIQTSLHSALEGLGQSALCREVPHVCRFLVLGWSLTLTLMSSFNVWETIVLDHFIWTLRH